MKFVKNAFILLALGLVLIIPSSSGNLTAGISEELKGRFLFVEGHEDEAWYADPTTGLLHYLGRANDALALMQQLGLGISNENLNKLKGEGVHSSRVNQELAQQLSGRILLQTEENNQAWYVWPENNQRYFIGQTADAQRVIDELGVPISEETFTTLQLSDQYYESLEVLDLASRAIQSISSERTDRAVEEAYDDGKIALHDNGNIQVVEFELTSPLNLEDYGYLGRDRYYWVSDGRLMRRQEYLASPEYQILEARSDAQSIIEEVLELQTALGFYYRDIDGYPLSQEEGDRIGTAGRMILTNPNGFFGTLRDPLVYHEISVSPDLLDFVYYSDGMDYRLVFSTEADTEFYPAGTYTLSPDGIEVGAHPLSEETCEDQGEPVCGEDGQTYLSLCHAEQADIEVVALEACEAPEEAPLRE
jgi:hypothetical protein